jgi:hypothetical protein
MPKRKKAGGDADGDGESDASSEFDAISDESDGVDDGASDDSSVKNKKKKATKAVPKKAATAKKGPSTSNKTTAPAPANGKKSTAQKASDASGGVESMKPTSSSTSTSAAASTNIVSGDEDITRGPEINTEAAAKKLIVRYLKTQNRPYSAIQIYDNLHKRIPKPMLERCLQTLSESSDTNQSELACKEYGKARIYYPNQMLMAQNVSESDMSKVSDEVNDLRLRVDRLQQEEKAIKLRIAETKGLPDDENMDMYVAAVTPAKICLLCAFLVVFRAIKALEKSVADKQARLAQLQLNPVDPSAYIKAIKRYNAARTSWKTHRDLCMEALENLSEGMEKPTKTLAVSYAV